MANEMMHAPKGAGAKAEFADYAPFLVAVKERVRHARTSAAQAVNRDLVELCWDIGKGIVEKQQAAGWGNAVVERLAADQRAAFPEMSGFLSANLWAMRRVYVEYGCDPILQQLVEEIAAATAASGFARRSHVAAGT